MFAAVALTVLVFDIGDISVPFWGGRCSVAVKTCQTGPKTDVHGKTDTFIAKITIIHFVCINSLDRLLPDTSPA